MDYQLKGLILNHTLKSYAITPIESANVLKVTMKFYGGYKYKSPGKRRRDMLRKKRFLAKFRKDPVLVPVPFLEPGQSPHFVSLGGLVLATMEASLIKQVHEIEEQIRGFHERWDQLAKEAEQAEKEQEKVSSWVRDLLDQRVDLRVEIGSMELELEQLKEERDRMKGKSLIWVVLNRLQPPVFQGSLRVLQLGQGHPKRKRLNRRDTLTCPHKRGKSTIGPT